MKDEGVREELGQKWENMRWKEGRGGKGRREGIGGKKMEREYESVKMG